jgi:hypothetical protein
MRTQPLPTHRAGRGNLWSILLSMSVAAHTAHADSKLVTERWSYLGGGLLMDKSSGLQWTQDDSRADLDWTAAQAYCDHKQGGWRLPRVQELSAIYDPTEAVGCAGAVCKVSPKFRLTGSWFWSATQVGADSTDGIELAWGVLLVNGVRTQSVMDAAYGSRALCVRDFKK